jgi:hypothetical protein
MSKGGGGGGGGGGTQIVEQRIDPAARAAYLENLDYAKQTASGLKQRQFADFTPTYGAAEQQLTNIGLSQFSPADIQRYMNPYEDAAITSALGDVERQRQMQQVSNASEATRAKAFGGSRQGVVESLTNEAALRQGGNIAAQMRAQGYQNAAQQAMSARQANLQSAGLVMTSAQQRQAQEQAQLDAARNLELERLGIRQAAMSAQPANLGMTQSQTMSGGGGNQLTGALGAGLAGYAMTGNPYIAGGAAALSLLG